MRTMRAPGARAFALIFLGFRPAFAQSPAPTALPAEPPIRITDCPEALAGPLPEVVKLEIDVLLRERGPTRAPPDRIEIRCAADTARIEVTMGGASRDSSLDLGVLAAEHRARAVALATAELVHSLSSRAPAPKAPPAPIVRPPAPSAKARSIAPPSHGSRPALLVGGLVEWLGKPATPLFGARVAFHYPVGSVLVPALSVDGSFGGFPAQSARVAAQSLTAAAHLYLGTSTGSVRWEAGPGARFGWLRLAGEPGEGSMLEGRTLAAAWGGPEARARVAYGAPERRSPRLALELGAGFVALPVRGLVDGAERLYAVEGPWLSVCAELGLGL